MTVVNCAFFSLSFESYIVRQGNCVLTSLPFRGLAISKHMMSGKGSKVVCNDSFGVFSRWYQSIQDFLLSSSSAQPI
jgi:hypothetical protein